MVTQVISAVSDRYSDQVVIDKGSVNGVYEGQPVIGDKGVVGASCRRGETDSRVLLICDATHALPIRYCLANPRDCRRGWLLTSIFS